jgi:hypothetical protein
MSAEVAAHHIREAGDHQQDLDHASVPHNKASHLSMHNTFEGTIGSAWNELFCIGGKIPNRRAYHLSFVWNNE